MKRVFDAASVLVVLALAMVGCAGRGPSSRSIPVSAPTSGSAARDSAATGAPHALGRTPSELTTSITTSAGVTCGAGAGLVAVSISCAGPQGSTVRFSADRLGPFGLQPTSCSSVAWTATSETFAPPAGLARARAPRALGGPYYCDTATSSSLTVSAGAYGGGVTIAHAYGTFTVCFDLPVNPCAPSGIAGPTVAIVATAPSPGSGGGSAGAVAAAAVEAAAAVAPLDASARVVHRQPHRGRPGRQAGLLSPHDRLPGSLRGGRARRAGVPVVADQRQDATPQYSKVEADCPHPGPSCELPAIPLHLPLGHAQWIQLCASYNGVMYHGGAAAYAQSNQECSAKFVANLAVVRYPRIAPPAGVPLAEVPFPDAPFRDCTGKKGTAGCDGRISATAFRGMTLEAYQKQGWAPPPGVTRTEAAGYEAHHIKPLQWGGENVGANGTFIPRADHLKFNNWWKRFDVGN